MLGRVVFYESWHFDKGNFLQMNLQEKMVKVAESTR